MKGLRSNWHATDGIFQGGFGIFLTVSRRCCIVPVRRMCMGVFCVRGGVHGKAFIERSGQYDRCIGQFIDAFFLRGKVLTYVIGNGRNARQGAG